MEVSIFIDIPPSPTTATDWYSPKGLTNNNVYIPITLAEK